MTDTWTWRYVDSDGKTLDPATLPDSDLPGFGQVFGSQSDAENWIGEVWPSLVTAGVDAVHLRCGDAVVYGPMSLRPAE
jgi:hypothetical protein